MALALGSNWTMGVLRADQAAIDDYARPRFYKVDWLPRFAVISISVHVSEAAHANQSVRVGEMARSFNGRLKTLSLSLYWVVISERNDFFFLNCRLRGVQVCE